MSLASSIKKHWFVLGIAVVILLAQLAPWIGSRDGPLVPQITVKVLGVSFIFFSSGLTLKSEDLGRSFLQVRLHMFVQLFTMAAIPVCMHFLVLLLSRVTSLHPMLLKGLMIVGCMPPPVSSATILTRASGGNEAAAIFNSAFGSFMGIFVTPALLLNTIGIASNVPVTHIVLSLGSTVVLPLLFGQVLRYYMWIPIKALNIPFGTLSSVVLLMIIYTAFCDTFLSDFAVDSSSLYALVLLVAFCISSTSVAAFLLSKSLGFSRRDVVCMMFSSTHKSLTLGMPMMKIIFEGNPNLSLISLPLLMYHPMQIMLGSFVVPSAKAWIDRGATMDPLLPS
eukprot:m.261221 g.261221  ORF g.261221 m.261221 type:complete len:337 (-) comp19692_c0_seq4:461-1471(-)